MVKTTLLYLKYYRNGNISKIYPKFQKKTISRIEKVSTTKIIIFFDLLQPVLNIQKDRFINKRVFLEGVRSP